MHHTSSLIQQGNFTLLFAGYVCISLNVLEFYSEMQLNYQKEIVWSFWGLLLGFVDGPRAAFGSNFFFIWRQYFLSTVFDDHALWFFLPWLVGALSIPSPMWALGSTRFLPHLTGRDWRFQKPPAELSLYSSLLSAFQILSTVAPPNSQFCPPHLREIAELLLGNPFLCCFLGIFPRWCARAILGLTLGANLGLTFYVSLLCSV